MKLWEFKCHACGLKFHGEPFNLVRCPGCDEYTEIEWVKELELEVDDTIRLKNVLKVYKDTETGDYVAEKINEFSHVTKSLFETEQGLLDHLTGFNRFDDLSNYELQLSNELRPVVISHLSKK